MTKEELKKENTELKARLQKKINTTTVSDYPYSALKLEEAKEILQVVLGKWKEERWILQSEEEVKQIEKLMKQTEQFLKELEIQEDKLCEYCDQYKYYPDGKRCRTCDNGSKWKRRQKNEI